MAPPGGHIVIVQKLTDIDYDSIADWSTHKAKVEAYIMRNLERVMPGFTQKVVVKLSASALTSHQFTLNHKGAMLGWEMSPDQLGDNRPALNGMLKNLYFVGHWTQPGGGITPVIVSAMQVARKITSRRRWHWQIRTQRHHMKKSRNAESVRQPANPFGLINYSRLTQGCRYAPPLG